MKQAAMETPGPGLLRDYRPRWSLLAPVLVFVLGWSIASTSMPQWQQALGLGAQLWLAYTAAWWALAWQRRVEQQRGLHWLRLCLILGLASLFGAVLGLYLLQDFAWHRMGSALWLGKRIAPAFGFALALHLLPLSARWREQRRHHSERSRLQQSAAVADLSRQVTLAELKTLQAQVEPHFLYNTLAGIQYLVRHNAPLADRMLGRLHDYLRLALPAMREPMSTLGREFALAEAYLALMQMRMGERLRMHLSLPDDMASLPFPPLMLGSLVENALQHGIEPKREGGELRIAAMRTDEGLVLKVSDSGIGLQAAAAGQTGGSGLGLSSLRERLRLLYGDAAQLEVGANADGGVTARVQVPLMEREVA